MGKKAKQQLHHMPREKRYRQHQPAFNATVKRQTTSRTDFDTPLHYKPLYSVTDAQENHTYVPSFSRSSHIPTYLIVIGALALASGALAQTSFQTRETFTGLSNPNWDSSLQTTDYSSHFSIQANHIATFEQTSTYQPSTPVINQASPSFHSEIKAEKLDDIHHAEKITHGKIAHKARLKASKIDSLVKEKTYSDNDFKTETPQDEINQTAQIQNLKEVQLALTKDLDRLSIENSFNASQIGFFSVRDNQQRSLSENNAPTPTVSESPTQLNNEDADKREDTEKNEALKDTTSKLSIPLENSVTGIRILREKPHDFISLATIINDIKHQFDSEKSRAATIQWDHAKYYRLGDPINELGDKYMPLRPLSHARHGENIRIQSIQNRNAYSYMTDCRDAGLAKVGGDEGYAKAFVQQLFDGDLSHFNDNVGSSNGTLTVVAHDGNITFKERLQHLHNMFQIYNHPLVTLRPSTLTHIKKQLKDKKEAILNESYQHADYTVDEVRQLTNIMIRTIQSITDDISQSRTILSQSGTIRRDNPSFDINQKLAQAYYSAEHEYEYEHAHRLQP